MAENLQPVTKHVDERDAALMASMKALISAVQNHQAAQCTWRSRVREDAPLSVCNEARSTATTAADAVTVALGDVQRTWANHCDALARFGEAAHG